MTLKEMLDSVLLESGMGTEPVYATNSDEAYNRLVNLANRAADYLASCHAWQALRKTYTLTLTSDEEYDLPSDFRELIPDTAYADSYYDPIDMRTDPGVWRYMKTNNISTGPRYRFRILGGKIQVVQPNVGDTVTFEYVSNMPVFYGVVLDDQDGDAETIFYQQRFTADNQEWVLDDEMLIMDILWRHKRLIGQPDYQEARGDATRRKVQQQGVEAGSKTIIGGEYAEPGGVPYTPLWVNNT